MSDDAARLDMRSPVGLAIVGLFLIAMVGALVLARSFLMPVVLAFMLSLTFSPVRRWLERRGLHAAFTALLIVVGLMLLGSAFALALSDPVGEYISNRAAIVRDVEDKLRGVSQVVDRISEASEQVEEIARGSDEGSGAGAPEKVMVQERSLAARAALNAPFMMAQLLLTLVLLFFLIASGDLFYEKLVKANPTFGDKRRAIAIAYDIERKVSRYFLTITAINAALGAVVGLLLWWLGMPNPLLFGVMAFALNFVPYLGAIAGVAVTFAIGVVSFDQLGGAALAAGAYLVCTTVEGQLVTPYLVGRSLKLNPVVVFVSVAFWGWAWSVIGMFIAVPVLLALRAFSESIPGLENVAIFLSGRDDETDETPAARPVLPERDARREPSGPAAP